MSTVFFELCYGKNKMGIPVLIIGERGSGKTASIINFDIDEVGVFCVSWKPLPFKKKFKVFNTDNYRTIEDILKKSSQNGKKCFVIDDSQYLMVFEEFRKISQPGYSKFTELALNMFHLIQCIVKETPPDCIVYLLHHSETTELGKRKAKTIGRMLDTHLTFEGLFSIVLFSVVDEGKYKFLTQSDGTIIAKSPMEMFPLEIDNDLKFVDTKIREYYGFIGKSE